MRVILDTNVLLSALLSSRAPPANLLAAWKQKLFTLVTSDALTVEFRAVATRPFFRERLKAGAAEFLAAGLLEFAVYCRDLPPPATPLKLSTPEMYHGFKVIRLREQIYQGNLFHRVAAWQQFAQVAGQCCGIAAYDC